MSPANTWRLFVSRFTTDTIVSFLHLINIQKTIQIKTDWKAFLFIIAPFCINIALSMQKNSMLNTANFAIMAAVAIIMNLGFIRTTLGAVCDKAKNLCVANCING